MPATLLMVLNPRRISECVESIQSLDVDRAWLTGFNESQLQAVIAGVVEDTDYDRYAVCSDDGVYDQRALDAVLGLHDEVPDEVATGYSNLDAYRPQVNLCRTALGGDNLGAPTTGSYDLFTQEEVDALREPVFRTYFTGMCLTVMSRAMWREFPFRVHNELAGGCCSDYHLSHRLGVAGVAIWAHRDAWVHHVKENWNVFDAEPRKRLLIGEVPAEVRYDRRSR